MVLCINYQFNSFANNQLYLTFLLYEFSEQQANRLPTKHLTGVKEAILLAACSSKQLLPMNPELPADLFTSCLTTPIKTALRWFLLQKQSYLNNSVTLEQIEKFVKFLQANFCYILNYFSKL